jgi:uncharacterized protein (DUF58 family)
LESRTTFELPPSTEEYAISTAATLAQHFLRRDRALGLISYGERREVIQADRGERQLTKVLETLAVLHPEGVIPMHELIRAEAQQLPRGTTVILITPSSELKWALTARQMERAGLRVVAIVIDGATFGGRSGAEELVAQLADSGTLTYLIRRNDHLEQALSQQHFPT